MSDGTTARLGLEQILPGQAQKEVSHNEALALLDLLVQPVVQDAGLDTPPGSPLPGQAWIVGTAPTGDWAGHAGALAGWTDGGWRFAPPFEGMAAWSVQSGTIARFSGGVWASGVLRGTVVMVDGEAVVGPRQPAITTPSGGATIDAEARVALAAILAALRTHGLVES